MTIHVFYAVPTQRVLYVILIATLVAAPSASSLAQGNPAAMSVLRGVQGGQPAPGPEGPESQQPQGPPGPGQPPAAAPATGSIDTRFISPNAAIVVSLRPAQILSAPIGQLLPTELAHAFIGFEAAEIDEVIAFGEFSNTGPGYGATFKFKNPIRAASIPVERRSHVQLAELGGKKYLKSALPMMYSLYGPNNKTLVAATDPVLQQLVQTAGQPKSGPMIDRLQNVPAGNDLYLAVDLTSLKPMLPMFLGEDSAKNPQAQQALELLNMLSGAELTLNVSNSGPTSLVFHCTDEAAAQKFELMLQSAKQQLAGAPQTPMQQALARYQERLTLPFQLQRNGTAITIFRVDGQNPAHQQLVSSTTVMIAAAAASLPDMWARNAARQRQAPGFPGAPPGAPGQPISPEAPGGPGSTPPEPAPPQQ